MPRHFPCSDIFRRRASLCGFLAIYVSYTRLFHRDDNEPTSCSSDIKAHDREIRFEDFSLVIVAVTEDFGITELSG